MPIVWQISALHLANKKTLLSGVILINVPYYVNIKTSIFRSFVNVIKSYFIRAYANKEIAITSNGKTINTHTDEYGSFQLVGDFQHNSEIKIDLPYNNQPLKIIQTYPITYQTTNSSFDVISDIDDTIIISYTADFFKRIGTLAFTPPHKRKTIDFSKRMFNEFIKQDARIFYVSKSESNLFGILSSFIEHNKLPKGNLFLTPYLNFSQLLLKKKKKNFKLDKIRFIIKNSENKKYVLFGDDSQQDMDIYLKIAKEFPQRILRIYIRQTKDKISAHQQQMLERLKSANVPVEYFKTDTDITVSNDLFISKKDC